MTNYSRLQEDLGILLDMYPELQLDMKPEAITNLTKVRGSMPFHIFLSRDLKVTFGTQNLTFQSLTDCTLDFEIDCHDYPSLRRGITLSIRSQWMSVQDRLNLLQAIHDEFDAMTDPESESYDEYAPVMMLIFGFFTDDSANILFKEQELLCESQQAFDQFAQMHAKIKWDEMVSSNFDCAICMETKKGDKMIKLPCGHALCICCTKSYFTAMIEQGSIERVRCIECEYNPADVGRLKSYNEIKNTIFTPAIPVDTFDGILSAGACQRYKESFHRQAAIRLSKHCPHACVTCRRCGFWCVKDNLDEPLIECTNCDFTFCFDCLHSWHGYNNVCGKKVGIPQEVIEAYVDTKELSGLEDRRLALETKYSKRLLELEANAFVADRMLDDAIATKGSNLQRCPKCRIVVQRGEGCNKMKCTVCDTSFCYICGEMLYADDPYEHYRKPVSECYARLFEGMPGTES